MGGLCSSRRRGADMEAFETFEHWGVKVELFADDDAGDPFENFDQASRLVWRDSAAAREQYRDVETVNDERENAVTQRWLTLFDGEAVALPFQYRDWGSSGQRAWICDVEDCDGFVCVSREKMLEEWPDGGTIDGEQLTSVGMAERCARDEFETWAAWL